MGLMARFLKSSTLPPVDLTVATMLGVTIGAMLNRAGDGQQ